jgi:RNA polymerase sigma factor (sigma-70 family)
MEESFGPFRADNTNPVFDADRHLHDWEQFAQLIEPLRAKLHRCIGLLIGDLDDAASLVQDVFARAGQDRHKLQHQSVVYPWLRAIGINLAKQYLEKRNSHAKPHDFQDEAKQPIHGSQRGALSEILKDELATKVWLAIGQLPEAYREAIVLHYIDGMDYEQISQVTGVSEGALRARAMRARNLLRGSLGSVVDTWMTETRDKRTS